MAPETSTTMFFFPFMASGHILPMLDMARLFARHGARAAVLATPSNAHLVTSAVRRASDSGHPPPTLLLLTPAAPSDLPHDWDDCSQAVRLLHDPPRLQLAVDLLRPLLRRLLADHRPDCLVSDMFLPWTLDVAAEFGIPRLVFHGMSLFAICAFDHLKRFRPHDAVSDDEQPFLIPGLPDRVEMTRSRLPLPMRARTGFNVLMDEMDESDARSFGVVVNSFREMEPGYEEHFRSSAIGGRAWHVGPVSLCSQGDASDLAVRGGCVDTSGCLAWLDARRSEPGSVIYVCFGTITSMSAEQLREIAAGLEASGKPFVWVVKEDWNSEEGWDSEGRGLVIRGWAPQVAALSHEAVGGFLTHCGWNSVLEAVATGVPMLTWPMFGDQYFNEVLVTEVLGVGERVAAAGGTVEAAVRRLMGGGEEVEGMRKRARRLSEMAAAAVAEGGSSDGDMTRLVEEVMAARKKKTAASPVEE